MGLYSFGPMLLAFYDLVPFILHSATLTNITLRLVKIVLLKQNEYKTFA